MNTKPNFSFRTTLVAACLTALAITSTNADQAAFPSFIEVGKTYDITIVGAGMSEPVKILASGGGGWFRVRWVTVATERWLNFAHVLSVNESKVVDRQPEDAKREPK